jgi:hypothetical protein|uniref:Uncharacterized protein n=1 Tax=viral metagenome TaxID=1070528 RepID=A0A6C0M226_9ZZZZ
MATQSAQSIISGVTLNPETDIKYAKVKVNNSGGKSVGILNAATNAALNIQTPLMLTWGVNENTDKKTGEVQSYTMALQFPAAEYRSSKIGKFFEAVQAFEAKVKRDAIANSKEWFGKAMSAEVIGAIFNPMLSYSKNPQTGEPDLTKNPTLRVKLPFYDGEWKGIEIYDSNQNALFPNAEGKTPKDLITKGSDAALIITCGGLWFAGGSFGVTWRLVQAVLKPKPSLSGKCHILLDDDEQRRIAAPVPSKQVSSQHDDDDHVASASHEVDVEDSDEDDDDDEARTPLQRTMSATAPAAPAAAAAAAAPKKIVAKKK